MSKKSMRLRTIVMVMVMALLMSSVVVLGETDGEKLKNLGFLTGGSDGDLNEGGSLTRAELAVILCRLNKVEGAAKAFKTNMGFTDVSDSSWYAGYVNYCKSKGWMNGNSGTTFDPKGIVSEEMVATVLLRVLGESPKWGHATNIFRSLSTVTGADNSKEILRSEVFTYMYETLNQTTKGSSSTLASQLGININHDDDWFGFNYLNAIMMKYDLNNNLLTYEGTSHNNSVSIAYNSGNYNLVVDNNFYINTKWIWQGTRAEGEDKMEGFGGDRSFYIVNTSTMEMYKSGTIESEIQPTFKFFTKDSIMAEIGSDKVLFDLDGNEILKADDIKHIIGQLYAITNRGKTDIKNIKTGKVLYEAQEFSIRYLDSGLIIVTGEDNTNIEFGTIDPVSEEKQIFIKVSGSYGKVNSYYHPKQELFYITYYNMNGLNPNYESGMTEIVNLQGEVIDQYNYYVSDYYGQEWNIMMTSSNTKAEIRNKTTGKIIVDNMSSHSPNYDTKMVSYRTMSSDIVYVDYQGNTDFIEDESRSIILSNGNVLVGTNMGFRKTLRDSNGNVVSGLELLSITYFPGVELLRVYGDDGLKLYNIDGSINTNFAGYDSFHSAMDKYVGAYKDGKTYILDGEGNVVYGPFDGKITFNQRR